MAACVATWIAAVKIHELGMRCNKEDQPPLLQLDARSAAGRSAKVMHLRGLGHDGVHADREATQGAVDIKPRILSLMIDDRDNSASFLDEFGADREQLRILDTKLRRLVSEGEYTRVGGIDVQKFKGTIIFGGSGIADLQVPQDISRDLYERIKTFHISLPPLRKRVADIIPLAEGFLAKLAKGDPVKILSPEARQLLLDYDWPGNVREIENCMKLLAGTLMTRTIERFDLANALKSASVGLLPVSKHDSEDDITPEHLLSVLKSVDGNHVEAAKILWPNYTLKEIRSWVRKKSRSLRAGVLCRRYNLC